MTGDYTSLDYTASVHYDWRLYHEDITASQAHARMLGRQGIISAEEAERICGGLEAIRQEIAGGVFPWRREMEDLHMNVEARLHDLIGETAGKLHTARSRNDQVATDMRLYLRRIAAETKEAVRDLQRALADAASTHIDTVMPGYTHLQRAQPVLLAHHLLAYVEMLDRDAERFAQAQARADVLPLGSGALAGAPYPLDRAWVAHELGFAAVSANSMDAVADRDFVLDYHYAAAACMAHLSRMAEEFVLWSTEEFGFLRLADADTTGSSIMPQKRNPDLAELARGRTGRVYGHLMAALTTLKGLPLTYNRDLQEDKEGLFDTVDTLLPTIAAFARMLRGAVFAPERMAAAAEGGGYTLATDLADYLVRRGMPFRQAHGVVADLTRYAQEHGKGFAQLTLDEYRAHSPLFAADVLETTVAGSLAARDVPGGTAPAQVAAALASARERLGMPPDASGNPGQR